MAGPAWASGTNCKRYAARVTGKEALLKEQFDRGLFLGSGKVIMSLHLLGVVNLVNYRSLAEWARPLPPPETAGARQAAQHGGRQGKVI